MRAAIFFICLSAFAAGLGLAQQKLSVIPQSLADWTIVNADRQAMAGQSELTLPAGSQLVRSFEAADITVELTTRPVIGTDASDWPELDLGSASLVFARNGTAGRLVFVIGNEVPLELPFDFALDADGRSTEPLTVTFGRNSSGFIVGYSGQTLQFPVEVGTGPAVEIVASAGMTQPWPFAKLAVTVGRKDPVAAAAGGMGLSSGSAGANAANSMKLSRSVASAVDSAPAALVEMASAANAKDKASGKTRGPTGTLETFTPPAVRYGRADALRASLLGKNR
jgi:hypothetical protein